MQKNVINKIGIVVLIVTLSILSLACNSESDGGGGGDGGGTTLSAPNYLYTWGSNASGQLGIGNTTDKNTPSQVSTTKTDWKQISVGHAHAMVVDNDGKLYAWGDNFSGQLGNGDTEEQHIPLLVAQDKTWEQVGAGNAFTLAIDTSGHLYAWGYNSNGQLGNGDDNPQNTPVPIEEDKTWVQVSAGDNHAVAIDTSGKLYAWGKNNYGQLGIGTETVGDTEEPVSKNTPVLVTPTKTNWKHVSAGGEVYQDATTFPTLGYTMAIDNDGKLYAWGDNRFGQLGIGNTDQQNTPVEVVIATDTTKTWKVVSAGGRHTLAIDNGGKLYAWGKNSVGQLGDGTIINKNTPTPVVVTEEPTKTWKTVAAGGNNDISNSLAEGFSLAIDTSGHLYAWGENSSGQLGIGLETVGDSEQLVSKSTPVLVTTTKTNWKHVSAGNKFILGIVQ